MEWRHHDHIITVSKFGLFQIAHEDNPKDILETWSVFRDAHERTFELKRANTETAQRSIKIPVLRSNGNATTVRGYSASTGQPRTEETIVGYSRSEFYYHTKATAKLLEEIATVRRSLSIKEKELNAFLIPRANTSHLTADQVVELEDELIVGWDKIEAAEYGALTPETTPTH